jgi:cysteine desulfurase
LDLAAKQKYVTGLKSTFLDHMKALGVSYSLLSPLETVPNIISLAVHGLRGETLLHALENQKIFVSTGSACSSRKREESAVLKAMKFSSELIDGSIRISIAASNTEQEMLDTAKAIAAAAKWLAKK